jgi:hypothetical protein
MAKKRKSNNQLLIDARKFQQPLSDLTETLSLKVQREAPKLGFQPVFTTMDLYFLLKLSHQTYRLFYYVNGEVRRGTDTDWHVSFSVVSLPLVRTMIDCLYNVAAILANPGPKGYQFRESGYRKTLLALDADEERYGGDPRWDTDIANRRDMIRRGMALDGITAQEAHGAKTWPTLGIYLKPAKNVPLTPIQKFLNELTFGFWEEYSGLAHGTFQGLLPMAIFLAPKEMPHEFRPRVEVAVDSVLSLHMSRVAGILLCTLTEVQAHFRFDGARINERLVSIWKSLLPIPEIRELYKSRYAKLMRERGLVQPKRRKAAATK